MRVLVGTSGFSFAAWKGSFYPERLPSSEMLPYYAARFPTVEINNTFHRLPKAELLEKWAAQVPDGFEFALKASERITHRARLGPGSYDAARYFTATAAALGGRLGPLLFQLPPYLERDVPRLADFLAQLPREVRPAFEFRDGSWFDDEVFAALERGNATLCVAEDDDRRNPPIEGAGADWGYVRLRRPDYDDAALRAWAERIAQQRWYEVFVYFKHEDEGKGPLFARAFQEIAARTGLDVRAAS